jgi:glutathione synthase/RimK-type ligase-like ATP-grasp enzyme
MKKIVALTDYRGYFGSKYNAIPYQSGMDNELLTKYFESFDSKIEFLPFFKVIELPLTQLKEYTFIYTSSEDINYYYKSFIEDVILYLEKNGAFVIPSYSYLRANNNKVYMELMRISLKLDNDSLKTKIYGCYEEYLNDFDKLKFPIVYKKSEGAMSKGVGISYTSNHLENKIKNISRTKNIFNELWELGRSFKHKGYITKSKYRKKYIIQSFIPNLDGDYKILIFANKYYVLKRSTKKNDFRASGSGIRNYSENLPTNLLNFAKDVFDKMGVPMASMDIAYDGTKFHLIEFQCVYFGTYTLIFSKFYWEFDSTSNTFKIIHSDSILELEFARSVCYFIEQNQPK